MKDKDKAIPLVDRWNMDVEFYKNNPDITILTKSPQCDICRYKIQGDVLHCKEYSIENKPTEIIFATKECFGFSPKEKLIIHAENSLEKKIYSGLFGFIVGDALGVPFEFSTREERAKAPAKEMRAYGTYHQYFGTWSDDSSLTLATLESFINGFSAEELARQFISYLKDGKFTPRGTVFDIGIGTQNAIRKLESGIEPTSAGGISEQDNGNGSLMRILPLAFYLQNAEPQKIIEMGSMVSSLTHGTKRAILGCIIYVVFAINLIKGNSKSVAYEKTIHFIFENCQEEFGYEFSKYDMVLNGTLASVNEYDIDSSGYVVDTLTAVIWTFLTTDDYSKSVLQAINLGGDTDTIAAIVGGLSGIFYGYENIPDRWIQTLAKKEYLLESMKKFSDKIQNIE